MVDAIVTQGDRIRALFNDAEKGTVIAPFIKVDALQSLLAGISPDMPLRCITRWLPREIAAGVSDPEILNMLEERGNFTLFLVDTLHAKLYIAGDRCLAGSANVTLAALGKGNASRNIEVLVETNTGNPAIISTLDEITKAQRPATQAMAQVARRLANNLSDQVETSIGHEYGWFPVSRRPERAFRLYRQSPEGYMGSADRTLLSDLARSNLPPGLEEVDFRTAIRSLLAAIPVAKILLEGTEDITVTRADANSYLETIAKEISSAADLWISFVQWMEHFFADKVIRQEIAEVALRRAQALDHG